MTNNNHVFDMVIIGGVYAVGDIRTKDLRQIVTAVADGAVAFHEAEKYLAGGA